MIHKIMLTVVSLTMISVLYSQSSASDSLKKKDTRAASDEIVKQRVFETEVRPFLLTDPNWKDLQIKVQSLKAGLGEEILVGKIIIFSLYRLAKSREHALEILNWAGNYYEKKFPYMLWAGGLNQQAWAVFENTNDKRYLTTAANWAKRAIQLDSITPNYYDTYANVLYRLGRKWEAIKWERKAIQIDTSKNAEFLETLKKMETGQATWPNIKSFGTPVTINNNFMFSGNWLLDTLNSDFGELTPQTAAPAKMILSESKEAIICQRDFVNIPGEPETLSFDGQKLSIEFNDTTKVTRYVVRSKDKTIVTVFSTYNQKPSQGQPREYTREEIYTLLDNGNKIMLNRITTLPYKIDNIKAVYVKQ